MSIYTFDSGFNTILSTPSTPTTAKTAADNVTLVQVYDENERTKTIYDNDTDTDFDNAFKNINGRCRSRQRHQCRW